MLLQVYRSDRRFRPLPRARESKPETRPARLPLFASNRSSPPLDGNPTKIKSKPRLSSVFRALAQKRKLRRLSTRKSWTFIIDERADKLIFIDHADDDRRIRRADAQRIFHQVRKYPAEPRFIAYNFPIPGPINIRIEFDPHAFILKRRGVIFHHFQSIRRNIRRSGSFLRRARLAGKFL